MASERKQHTREGSRRPIAPGEVTCLEALGLALRRARHDYGLAQAGLAIAAELSPSTIGRIEAGTRRTRRSTLDRIAAALGQPDLAAELARLAGPTLAPESPFAERIERRRRRRFRRQDNRGHAERREVAEQLRELARLARRAPEYEQ